MRYTAILAGSLGLVAVSALPVAAQQTPPPLAYVQPLPVPAVQSVQEQLQPGGRLYRPGSTASGAPTARRRWSGSSRRTNCRSPASSIRRPPRRWGLIRTRCWPRRLPRRRRRATGGSSAARVGAGGAGAAAARWASIAARWMACGARGPQRAIENFQRGRGLQTDGQLGPATLTAMGLAPDALAYR